MARQLSYLRKITHKMKNYLLLILMQIAVIQAFAQRGGGGHGGNGGGGHSGGGTSGGHGSYSGGRGGGGGHSYGGGGHSGGGTSGNHSYSGGRGWGGGHSYGGGHYHGGPSAYHSFGGRNYGHYNTFYRGYGYGHGYAHGYAGAAYRGYGRNYYRGDRFGYRNGYYGYHHYAPGYFRNWEFGWGLGFWNPALYWQQSFYSNLFNCYEANPYYAPDYFNGYISDFDQLVQSINNQPNDDNKMTVAREAVDYRYVSSAQVAAIMNCFASDQAKIDFAEYAYPHVTDKRNFYQVNNTFTDPESAQQLGGYLDSQYGNRGTQGNYQNNQQNQQNNQNDQNNQVSPPPPSNPPAAPRK